MKKTATKKTALTTLKAVKLKGKSIKPLYTAAEITTRTNGNLWTVFEAGNAAKAIVYSMTLSRDEARNVGSKFFGTNITNIRAKRVKRFRIV